MHRVLLGLMICLLATPAMAGQQGTAAEESLLYVATIPPVAAILSRVVEGRGRVETLLAPGSSPHTFAPKPSDLQKLARAAALFSIGPNLDRQWAEKLPARHRVELLSLLPATARLPMLASHHDHHGEEDEKHRLVDDQEEQGEKPEMVGDPHFWTDPLRVKVILEGMVETLGKIDPNGESLYRENCRRFGMELEQLDREVARLTKPLGGRPIVLFHPSFNYFIERYGLFLAGVIEEAPGKEPSPRYLHLLVKKVRQLQATALFAESQLSPKPVQVLAEAAGVEVYELDPLGGVAGRRTYAELILYNARTLAQALGQP